jgi:hypothetical protein
MKPALISYIRFHTTAYQNSQIEEREYLQTILDLCVERLVDLDHGRDDNSLTGGYDRSELAAVLVEAEMLNSRPPSDGIKIDLSSDELEDDSQPPPATILPPPFGIITMPRPGKVPEAKFFENLSALDFKGSLLG